MQIKHRISLRATSELQRRLRSYDILIGEGLSTFEVDENHPHWSEIAEVVREVGALDIVSSVPTGEELQRAQWLAMRPSWHWSYPQPERDMGYLGVTYDLSDHCPTCGIGARQKEPFRLKREPQWGDKGILQLNWVFDEYFVRPDVWAHVFEPFGIAKEKVLDARSGQPLSTVVQLRIDKEAEVRFGREHDYRLCPRCERKKYRPVVRGCFPAPVLTDNEAAMLKTRAYFGDGARAFHSILVSQQLSDRIQDCHLVGASFLPACV